MPLRISEVQKFLEGVKETEGDLKIQSIMGFWVRTIPATGERVVVPAVGDGKSLEDVLILIKTLEQTDAPG